MLKRFYDRTMALAAHRHAKWWLALISFVESSVFPIPPDVILIPMVLARRTDAWRIAVVCTLASVAGGCAGYAIGFFLFDAVGRPLLEFYGQIAAFDEFRRGYNEWGAWIVFGVSSWVGTAISSTCTETRGRSCFASCCTNGPVPSWFTARRGRTARDSPPRCCCWPSACRETSWSTTTC